MVVTTIYVSRHGFRGTWSLNPATGVYTSNIDSPTGIAGDPPLVAYGVQQSQQLADALTSISPPIAQIYSSPFYRCLQTIQPTAEKLGLEIRADNGLGEWFGRAPFSHPQPAQHSVLTDLFPTLAQNYVPSCVPSQFGESISELHARCEITLSNIISHADAESGADPIAILICTHAAALIAIGRVLTGCLPSELDEEDFYTYTAGITKFERKHQTSEEYEKKVVSALDVKTPSSSIYQKIGKGVVGNWNCVSNCDCTHLSGGGERGWHFSGDESFTNPLEGAKL
ncbi:MAG: hypothetical protein Q9191_004686 [Dirinaria sp. TL-2023a]